MGNYLLYSVSIFFARVLPLKMAYALGIFLADCQFRFSTKDRQAVESNLKVVLGQDQVDATVVREVFRNFGRYLVEFYTMTRQVNSGFIAQRLVIKNIGVLNEVLARGRGGILVSGHLGNWELGATVLPQLGYPLHVVALPHKDPRVNAFFNAQREAFGSQVIQTTVAVRHCLQILRQNKLVAMIAERDFGHAGVALPFLGRVAPIPKGPAVFSLKTGAALIPTFIIRQSDGTFVMSFDDPINACAHDVYDRI